jgi:hypothetical protein
MAVINSIRALANAVGCDEKAIRRAIAQPGWPVRRSAPWTATDATKVNAWRATRQEDRASGEIDSAQAGKVNTGLKLERMLLTRAQRKRLEGELIPRNLLDAALEGLSKLFVQSLDDMIAAMSVALAGKDPGEIEHLLKDRVRTIRESLHGRRLLELEVIDQAVKSDAQTRGRGRPAAKR